MTRSGIVALVGRANVGKSSLLNHFVGEKVSIVSPIVQTTRSIIRAVLTESRGQLVFLDTPGMHKAQSDLGRLMNKSARAATDGADLVMLILDGATRPRDEDAGWMRRLIKEGMPAILVLNKSDMATDYRKDYERLWQSLANELQPEPPVAAPDTAWYRTSAQSGQGVTELLDELFARMPEAPPLFDEEMLTDFPRKLAIADIIREKYFAKLRDELPHAIAVNVREIEEAASHWRVSGDILVHRGSQKGIVLGRKGQLLKQVRQEAEAEASAAFDVRVKLDLWVKVEPHWSRNFFLLRQLGYT